MQRTETKKGNEREKHNRRKKENITEACKTQIHTHLHIYIDSRRERESSNACRKTRWSAVDIAGRVFRPLKRRKKKNFSWQPTSHVVEYGVVCDPNGNVVDDVLAVPMLAPRSYTREDVVELQCHGSDVCLHRVLRACLEAGARLAEPGEFTLRDFLNGRLDLSQAEDVGKLVSAKFVVAADAALAGIQGGFSSLVNSLRAQCIELLIKIEGRLDFDDEMPPLDMGLILSKISAMSYDVETAMETANYDKFLQSELQTLDRQRR